MSNRSSDSASAIPWPSELPSACIRSRVDEAWFCKLVVA